jgi:Lon protease-like protein
MTVMERQYTLPLFPLNTVLFPGMPLPLHVFEEQYRLMINECLDKRQPFGVALIKRGREVGGGAVPHRVGTSAIITSVTEQSDGELDVVTVGYQRFRILSFLTDRPYPSGLVETLPPVDEDSEEAHLQANLLRPRLKEYIQVLGELTQTEVELDQVPEKPVLLAFLTAILLQVPRADKQSLLATETIPDMLARENLFLARETTLLQARVGTEFILEKSTFSTS